MNKKIKELMERVRLTDEELDAAWDSIPLYTEDDVGRKFAIADSQLNKFLNDRDLALIDGDAKEPKIPETYRKSPYVYDVYADGWRNGIKWYRGKTKERHTIIPLADALGEKE